MGYTHPRWTNAIFALLIFPNNNTQLLTKILLLSNFSIMISSSLDHSDELNTPAVDVDILKTIAETGFVDANWSDLQNALKQRFKAVLEHYIENHKDDNNKEDYFHEPNVEKFDLDRSRDEILDLISSFNEAPFTIQRVCELLYSPFKYYDRISNFLRAIEKNLRVISSNDWPKSNNNNTAPS